MQRRPSRIFRARTRRRSLSRRKRLSAENFGQRTAGGKESSGQPRQQEDDLKLRRGSEVRPRGRETKRYNGTHASSILRRMSPPEGTESLALNNAHSEQGSNLMMSQAKIMEGKRRRKYSGGKKQFDRATSVASSHLLFRRPAMQQGGEKGKKGLVSGDKHRAMVLPD